ncbi:TfoX/Sxy family protein [Catellatospora chokoriensis]|uniref:RNA methyltransferase n=1 Tax=Catellatospora chokoriensis TaxID=310353 RepID=A0A8J3NS71_9ACTN|nr:TfoX/Sxy family protein [Catellatospora chokoriensis]GIF88910.1 RNA methyltransferase [Catellatospora chokoriensis]
MAYDRELAERLRGMLDGQAQVREVSMFGGLSFMVNEQLAVAADTGGDLMVRVDPHRVDELLGVAGAHWAEMRGRRMSKGWLVVSRSEVDTEESLRFWVGATLEHAALKTDQGSAPVRLASGGPEGQ